MPQKRFTNEQIAFALRQAENAKLKRLVADLGLDKTMLQDAPQNVWSVPVWQA